MLTLPSCHGHLQNLGGAVSALVSSLRWDTHRHKVGPWGLQLWLYECWEERLVLVKSILCSDAANKNYIANSSTWISRSPSVMVCPQMGSCNSSMEFVFGMAEMWYRSVVSLRGPSQFILMNSNWGYGLFLGSHNFSTCSFSLSFSSKWLKGLPALLHIWLNLQASASRLWKRTR